MMAILPVFPCRAARPARWDRELVLIADVRWDHR